MTFLERLGAALTGPSGSLEALWDSLDVRDHARRLVVAHYLADVQRDLESEIRWDEIALMLADQVTDEALQEIHPTLTVAGFIPSLQLNLADGYRRAGRFDDAARALADSVAFTSHIPAGGGQQGEYRQLILDGQRRIGELIAARDSADVLAKQA
ncbi:hypothetical protein [Sporichthya polymorpha]|uniref:hypothetical protein n=1 Tax=Sporichthya polymorpha TaxID=35751 RepID=UPI0003711980|nr:hypothetical protein [Sporichthya polymorpha]